MSDNAGPYGWAKTYLKVGELQVRNGNIWGEPKHTNTGDCARVLLFVLYLPLAFKPASEIISDEHNYSKLPASTEEILPEDLVDRGYIA